MPKENKIDSFYSSINSLFLGVLLMGLILFWSSNISCAQTPEQDENSLRKLYGIDKLKALTELSERFYLSNQKKSYRYARQAASLAENIFHKNDSSNVENANLHIKAYFLYGKMLFEREKYLDSKEYLDEVILLSFKHDEHTYRGEADGYLQEINAKIALGEVKESLLSKTVGNLGVGKAISKTSANLSINTELKIAESNEKNGDFQGAINHYEKAINLLRNQGDNARIGQLQLKVAVLLDSLGQHIDAQKLLNTAIIEMEATDPVDFPVEVRDSLTFTDTLLVNTNIINRDSLQMERENLKALSDQYLAEENYEKSVEYLRMYRELSAKMEKDSVESALNQQRREEEILLLKQQKEIADLNVEAIERENEKQVRYRKTIIFIALLISLATIIILHFYFTKRRDHKKLVLAYSDLENTRNKLEKAEKRIVTLLKQQVSGDIATELITSNPDKPGEKRFVCVMFLDIRDFTPMAEKLSPEQLIAYQNMVFGFMIDIVQEYHGNINQLLGDGFMATFGAPVSHNNDCLNAFLAAKKIIQELEKRNHSTEISPTKIGIGLHAGYVVTGNVGNEARKQYSVTGNPVIVASRVEQLNKKHNSKLIITEEVYKNLNGELHVDPEFIEEAVKGRKEPVRILKFS